MPRILSLVVVIITAGPVIDLDAWNQGGVAARLEVVSARRAKTYAKAPRELRATQADEVILVVAVSGVPDHEWSSDKISLIAGEKKIKSIRRVRMAGTDDKVAVFQVPVSVYQFELKIGSLPTIKVVPDEAIVENIMLR